MTHISLSGEFIARRGQSDSRRWRCWYRTQAYNLCRAVVQLPISQAGPKLGGTTRLMLLV